MRRCKDIHRSRRERSLSLSPKHPTLRQEQSCWGYEAWNGQATPLNSLVIPIVNAFPATGFHHRTRAFQPRYDPTGLMVDSVTLTDAQFGNKLGRDPLARQLDCNHCRRQTQCPVRRDSTVSGSHLVILQHSVLTFMIASPKLGLKFSPPGNLERTCSDARFRMAIGDS